MKIALLSFEYPPETGFGGIGSYTWYHARALVKLRHEVDVISGSPKANGLASYEQDGVQVHRFRSNGLLMRGFQTLDRYRLWWSKNRLENAFSMYGAFKTLQRKKHYDLIEMPECGAEGMLINHLTGAITVIKLHSPSRLIMPFYDVRDTDIRLCSFFEQLGIRGASAFSSCSQFLAREAQEKLRIHHPIRVIPNGIDLELFDHAEQFDIRRHLNIPQGQLIILFSGRMERRKGIHLCKEIVPGILERYDVSFLFAGQDLFNYMSDNLLPYWKTKKFRGSVHYLGKLDHSAIRSYLRQADIFLLPSLWENCPYSCLEAMAAGRAIVSTNQGGMPELLGECGLLARNADPMDYIACLERLIEDPHLRENLGVAARKRIEQSFTDVRIARLSTEYYQECLNHTGQL